VVLPEELACLAGAVAGTADEVDVAVGVELADPAGEFGQGDEGRAGGVDLGVLVGLADVDELGVGGNLVDIHGLHVSESTANTVADMDTRRLTGPIALRLWIVVLVAGAAGLGLLWLGAGVGMALVTIAILAAPVALQIGRAHV